LSADFPAACPPIARNDRTHPSQFLSQAPEERVADLSLRRLCAILDLRQKLGFDPDTLVADPLGIGLGPSDKGFQPLLQRGGRYLVEAVVDLAGLDEIIALAPADVKPVPLAPVEREAGDGQRLPLRAGLLHPVVRAPRRINAVADLGDDTFETKLAGVFEHLATVDLEAFAELDVGASDDLLQFCLALKERQLSELAAVQIERSKATRTMLVDLPLSSFCRTEKSVVPSPAGTTISPSTTAVLALMRQASWATFLKRCVQSWPRRVNIFAVSLARWTWTR
jgi:hypothetical protein